jgi:hypothetical protein
MLLPKYYDMSYKIKDLKRLKRDDELLSLFEEIDLSKYKKNTKKTELVDLLSETTPSTSGARCQATNINFVDHVYVY